MKEVLSEKNRRVGILIIIAVVLLIAGGFGLSKLLYVSPQYDDTVTHYSNQLPRVGNNIYGYIDVPEGYMMEGSFNPADSNYAGGEDGIAEGVRLYNQDKTSFLTISLLTGVQGEYAGFGPDESVVSETIGGKVTGGDVWFECLENLADDGRLSYMDDNAVCVNSAVYGESRKASGMVNGLYYDLSRWNSQKDGKLYYHLTYIFENPNRKNTFHCVTATYTDGDVGIVDYLRTFSLSMDAKAQNVIAGVEGRGGNEETGYINLPAGYDEMKSSLYKKWKGVKNSDSKLSYFVTEEPVQERVILGCFSKNELFESNAIEYMNQDFVEMLQDFGGWSYNQEPELHLVDENAEFGAKAFVSVMEQSLRPYGLFEYAPASLDGKNGYRIVWKGRKAATCEKMYVSCYILEDGDNPEQVYFVGAQSENTEGQFWDYLNSFSTSK